MERTRDPKTTSELQPTLGSVQRNTPYSIRDIRGFVISLNTIDAGNPEGRSWHDFIQLSHPASRSSSTTLSLLLESHSSGHFLWNAIGEGHGLSTQTSIGESRVRVTWHLILPSRRWPSRKRKTGSEMPPAFKSPAISTLSP
jgi:hypothetical protein